MSLCVFDDSHVEAIEVAGGLITITYGKESHAKLRGKVLAMTPFAAGPRPLLADPARARRHHHRAQVPALRVSLLQKENGESCDSPRSALEPAREGVVGAAQNFALTPRKKLLPMTS